MVLQNKAGDSAYQDVESKLTDFMTDFKEYDAEMKEFGLPAKPKWSSELSIHVLLNNPQWLVLKVYENEFTGGAHANSNTEYININLKTGQIDSLSNLVQQENLQLLDSIARLAFIEQIDTAQDYSIIQTSLDFANNDGFTIPKNFFIQKEGISFHFNTYDAVPYSLGDIGFSIDYNQLNTILNHTHISLDTIRQEIKDSISIPSQDTILQ